MTIAVGSLLAITLYSIFAVFLNKLYTAKTGKTTFLAWVPGFNIYLLGRLAVHWTIGLLLILALLFGICISFEIPYLESIYSIMPKEYELPYQIGYGILFVIILIVGKIKLNNLIRTGASKETGSIFINKDYNKKEPEIVVNNKPVDNNIQNSGNDFYHPNVSESSSNNNGNNNQTTLASLRHISNNEQNNNNQNP